MKTTHTFILLAVATAAGGFIFSRAGQTTPARSAETTTSPVARGKYLVKLGGCTDCHTPKTMTSHGPVDDASRRLAGHPAEVVLSAPTPDPEGPWGAATAGMTAWSGPWGVAFAANLTPDVATGIGAWSREDFIRTLRTGKHKGTGRAILPPMPWQPLSEATEEDLTAIFTYLRSLPAVSNRVPEPLPPAPRP